MELEKYIEEFRKKNYINFEIFYQETKKSVFFSIAGIIKDEALIEDLIQDTYVRFLENIDKYHRNTNIKAFLSKIAYNLAINMYNKRKREVFDDEVIAQSSYNPNPLLSLEVERLLAKISSLEREIVILHVINDLKFRDIANIVGKPLGTVLWLYNKAMKKMKEDDSLEK